MVDNYEYNFFKTKRKHFFLGVKLK